MDSDMGRTSSMPPRREEHIYNFDGKFEKKDDTRKT
jgi:hypothetical protein